MYPHLIHMDSLLGCNSLGGQIPLQIHPEENYPMGLVGLGCLPFLLEAQASEQSKVGKNKVLGFSFPREPQPCF